MHSDGNEGTIQYRNHMIESLYNQYDFEDVAFLLIWGHFPSSKEKGRFQKALALQAKPPPGVVAVIKSLP